MADCMVAFIPSNSSDVKLHAIMAANMPSLEHGERNQGKEKDQTPYYRAARFGSEKPASQAYFAAQESIFSNPDCDLSVFRIQLVDRISHVVVLGDPPAQELEQKLLNILSAGESVSLSRDILKALQERRADAIKRGPWVERHYRPGENL